VCACFYDCSVLFVCMCMQVSGYLRLHMYVYVLLEGVDTTEYDMIGRKGRRGAKNEDR
jgi:hypothetical protein